MRVSLKGNTIANFIGQIYITIVGIVMLPIYLKYMGKEAYGLVGFYSVLNSWLILLDLGFTPALGREIARFRGGAIDAGEIRSLVRAMLILFAIVGFVIVVIVALSCNILSKYWLKVETLSYKEVNIALTLMGVVFSLKWPSGIFKSVIIGFEEQVGLNIVNMTIATLKFVFIIPIFHLLGATPRIFFTYQVLIAMIELVLLANLSYKYLPSWPIGKIRSWTLKPLLNIWRFAISVAFLTFMWILLTQTDKLILTKLLPLSEYAIYAIAVTAAGGIMTLINPISQAVLPRLTRLVAENERLSFQNLYRKTSRIVCAAAGTATVVCVAYSKPLLWAWTGDMAVSDKAASIFAIYTLGNFLLVIAGMQYNMQFAHGDLKLHIRGNLIFPFILIPSVIWSTLNYGMLGSSITWMLTNLIFLVFWTPIVHHRFFPSLHKRWITKDILPIVFTLCVISYLLNNIKINCDFRELVIVKIVIVSILALFCISLLFRDGREIMLDVVKKIHSYSDK